MDQLAASMNQLTERVDKLGSDLQLLGLRVDNLVTLTERMDGRIGRLEGWRFETKYRENLASHLVGRFRRAKLLIAGNVPALLDALDADQLTTSDWTQVIALDVLASAIDFRDPEHPEVYVAIELSLVIDPSDVERARERADILARALDLPVVACVDGEAILRDAEFRAAELNVVNLRG